MKLLIFLLCLFNLLSPSASELLFNKIKEQHFLSNKNTLSEKDEINFVCGYAESATYVSVETKNDKVNLEILHIYGLEHSPIYDGVLTTASLPYIKEKADILHKMGTSIKVSFDKKNCKIHQEGNFSCYERSGRKIGDLEVKSYGFQTYMSTSKLYGLVFKNLHMNFSVVDDYISRDMRTQFDMGTSCVIR